MYTKSLGEKVADPGKTGMMLKKFIYVISCHSHQNLAFDVYKLIGKKRLTHTNPVYN